MELPYLFGRRECLIFLHVPKTAGTSLMSEIQRQYKAKHFYRVPANRADPRGLEEFRALPKKRRLRVLAGHIAYGIHRELPHPARYFTLLRDPVARALSAYRYARQSVDHPQHAEASTTPLIDFGIARAGGDNMATRQLAGGMNLGTQPLDRPVNETDLARALEHVSTFDLVGLTERYEESLRRLAATFGWRDVQVELMNVSTARVTITDRERARLAERNSYDDRLYRWAVDRFNDT